MGGVTPKRVAARKWLAESDSAPLLTTNFESGQYCVVMYTIQHRGYAMPASTTMTIRVRADVKEKLDRIAADTQRSKSFLAGEAVAAYVDRELSIMEGIQRGKADAAAGRIVPHDEAMEEIYAVIDAAEAKRTGMA